MKKFITTLCASALFSSFAFAELPKSVDKQIELFTKPYEFSDVKISPNGTYLSVVMNENNIRRLLFLDAKTMKPTYVVRFSGDEEIGSYTWVNDKRVAIEKVYNRGWQEEPVSYGEIFTINANGKRPLYLFGQLNNTQQTGSQIKKNTAIRAIGQIQHGLPDDDKHVLVHATPIGNGSAGFMTRNKPLLYKVNVYNGRRKKVVGSPIPAAGFILDKDKMPAFVVGTSEQNEIEIYQHRNDEWISIDHIQGTLNDFRVLGYAESKDYIYAEGLADGKTQALYKVNIKSGEREKITSNDNVDPLTYWQDSETNELFAVEFADGYPEYVFVNKTNPNTKALKALLEALPGHQLRLVSKTLDNSKQIILAFNDRNDGDYYLFDSTKNNIAKIASHRSWLDPNDLADVKPVKFKSRDGLTIHGYITMPYGVEHKNLPLVVNPHGGPIARDYWQYNPQAQLLAANGIATLQINFRGSAGYGLAFKEAGYVNWGTKTQYDIIDGVKYVIDQGWINKDKVCIEGGSFGAYSALQSAVIEPDMFKCAIGVAGVYDLPMMKEEGDIPSFNFGEAYLAEVLGGDINTMKQMSPAYNANKLKARILLVHGERDERTPIEQYESMTEALDKAGYPYEKMIFGKEGHGFYNPENQAKYYKKMLSFVKESLKL
ncbi:peptidase S9 [Shewanella sp. OPT22]|nr:peptidase S9 [Shewanella sp. OPT22]